MDRQHRRDLKHDRFVDEIGAMTVRARDNQRFLLTITVGVVAAALVIYGIYFYRSNHEHQAQQALAAAIATIDSPLIPDPAQAQQQQQPPPANAKYKTEAERNAAAQKQFDDLKKNYSGTDAGDIADLYLARLAAAKGDVASSRKLLESFIAGHPRSVLVGSARYSLYQMRIDNGEAAQVISELENELKKDRPLLPGDSILALQAHAYTLQGNAEKSKEAYRRLVTDFPDSPWALDAQRRAPQA
ncbi:MAG: tol-pal system protein YbgF [Acidobacteria bacterium]|nr:tol-pal system protein YbgF [Acidobacteriota bacterium]